jgi:hypothetical protein
MGYLAEERETHLYLDGITREWTAWTNMPHIADKLRRCGWKQTGVGRVDGEEVDWTFTMTDHSAITIRDMTKPKRIVSEQQKAALKAARMSRQ